MPFHVTDLQNGRNQVPSITAWNAEHQTLAVNHYTWLESTLSFSYCVILWYHICFYSDKPLTFARLSVIAICIIDSGTY